MGMRINYNGAAANAWRSLGTSQDKLSGSVEKLSSGLRINKGADDPAGLIISERLKSQITGLGQAIKNAQEATSLVQTGEGALTEMNSMLNKMRGLAVHSANAGVNDTDTIAADQRQIDSALDSLEKISQNTKYQSKILLDGSATNSAAISSQAVGTMLSAVDVKGDVNKIYGGVNVTLTQSADVAHVNNYDVKLSTATAITLSSSDHSDVVVTFASSSTQTQVKNAINAYTASTGITASNGTTSTLTFTFNSYGDNHNITIHSNGTAAATTSDAGQDIAGSLTVNKVSGGTTTLNATGSGLDLTVANGEFALAGTKVTVAASASANGTDGTNVFTVSGGALQFSLGQDASSTEIRTLSIANMSITSLGQSATGLSGSYSLNDIRSGGTYQLSADAANAVKIIDKAIDDVSISRATLGAFQQNALETTINTLSINKENLEASNSRIADVDMAQEMMQFTKNQILTQAGTAMLAQANQLPRSVMQLLQG